MARIAFAWELGAAFGHATACASLAGALEARGHTSAFFFRELAQLASLPEAARHEAFQAPVSRFEPEAPPVSYADILLGCGYREPATLRGLLARWIELLGTWKPDLIVADSAPTALLAARVLKVKRVAYGNGFAIPPRSSPLPPFRIDRAIDAGRIAASDSRALATVNAVLAERGAEPLEALAQQFETDEDFLCTFPDLDHYGTRPRAGYWGPRYNVETGSAVGWPYGEGKRVALYLRNEAPQLDAVIDAIAASGSRVAAFVPRLDAGRRARLRSAKRVVADAPMRLKPLLESCDLFVSEGGDTAAGALMSGVPQLVCPTQYEQSITALRLEQVGSALWLAPDARTRDASAALGRMLDDERFKANARAYASRYRSFSPAEQRRRIVLRIEQIASGPILSPTTKPGSPA